MIYKRYNSLNDFYFVAEILPLMINRKSGHIVAVSSIQGRVAIPFRYGQSLHFAYFGIYMEVKL